MSDLGQLRGALADQLSSITGWQVSAYLLTQPTPPAIQILPGPAQLRASFGNEIDGGPALWRDFKVQAIVAFSTDIGAQVELDLLSDQGSGTSVARALEADQTLGGLAAGVVVDSESGVKVATLPGGSDLVLLNEFNVRVFI